MEATADRSTRSKSRLRAGHRVWTLGATVWLLASCLGVDLLWAQSFDLKSQRVDSLFAHYGAETPGISIRVVKDGMVVHRAEYGMASLEHEIPVGPTTVFAIGSNSKQFTGFAIAILAEEGLIDLDEDVRTYVPEVPDFGHKITIRHLLHHTSGIRDWVRPLAMAGYSPSDAIPLEDVLEFLKRQQVLNFSPGSKYMYSNTGYVLLAEVVTRVTGMPYPEWMEQRVFAPLGMTSTRVRRTPYDVVKNIASSYYPAEGSYLNVRHGLSAYGSCCILSTADDMVKWLRNFETANVGGRDVIRTMLTDTVSINEWDGRLVAYGYGLMHFRYRGLRGLFHSGQWVGFRSATLRVPEQDLSIVVLGNIGPSGNLKEWQVLEIYADDTLDVDGEPASGNGAGHTLDDMEVAVDTVTLDRYVGVYDFGTPDGSSEILTVDRDADRLVIKFTTDRAVSTWVPISTTDFRSRADGPTLGFETGNSGPASAARWRGKSYPRVDSFRPSEEQLREFTGTFYSEELDTGWLFDVEDEHLVAKQMRWGGTLTFTPTVRDEFRGSSLITSARFTRNIGGDITGVLVSGYRALDNQFLKVLK